MEDGKLTCKVCDRGTMEKKQKHRQSGPAVVIGYILLIPSVIGILIGLVLLLIAVLTPVGAVSLNMSAQEKLRNANVPQAVVTKVMNHDIITYADKVNLTPQQSEAVDDAERSYVAGALGAGAGVFFGLVSVICIVGSFVGGLTGWILVMKKKVLQCSDCGAVVNAS